MMARTRTDAVARWLLTALLLLVMFGCMHDQAQAQTQSQAQTQGTRATVGSQPEAARVPPPGDDDPTAPPYNGALPAGQTVPDTMVAGGSYTVTVKMKNTGNTSWTSEGAYRLGSNNPTDNWTWGGARVALAAEIPPGETSVFTFQVTAPANPGSYNFQWGMVQDGVQWFGAPSNNVVVNVTAPPRVNGASIVGQSVPAQMTAGQVYAVSMTLQNTGNTSWASSALYNLGSPLINGVQYWNGGRVPMPRTVAPGEQITFNFNVTAPSNAGSYPFNFQMVQDGVEFFGQAANIAVNVTPAPRNDAQFIGQTVPPTMTPGQAYPVTVVMQNTGTTTWAAHGNTGLASSNPLANNTWNAVRIDQPTTTAPGQNASYTFQVTAPGTPGTYNFQWKMVQDGVEWFGAATANLAIQVAAQGDTVTYIHTDALGSPVARSDSAGNVISRTSYEPYGRTAGGVTPTIGFTGHVNDADTGLVYMQQRYYDPVAGRFLSVDPVSADADSGGSFNRYAYANNSPYKYIDPDGRFSEAACADMGRMNCDSGGSGTRDEAKHGSRKGGTQPNTTAQIAMDMSAAEFEEFAKSNSDWKGFRNLKVEFFDGRTTEIDRIYINQETSQAVCIECKTGPNAKYTPTQRNYIDDLARGRYFVLNKNFPLAPGFLLQEGYIVRSYMYGVDTLRINRSPTTDRFKRAGGRTVYRSMPARGAGAVVAP